MLEKKLMQDFINNQDTNFKLANAIRALSADAVQKANSGHPGMPLGMADVSTILFKEFLKFNPEEPNWPDRDRFILSAGHGSMLLYSLLYLTGYEDVTIEQIKNFRQLDAKTAGHPEYGFAGGIETTTGPLGQGLANSVGFAMAERLLADRFGDELVNHFTYVIAGDGCLMEGISQEAISLAGHLKLSKLIVLFDDNNISIDGPTSLSTSDDHIKRFEASNWDTQVIDGHNYGEIREAIANAQKSDKPSLIACKTTIAYGTPTKAGTSASHGAPLGDDEIAGLRKELGWEAEPFDVPQDILDQWREVGSRGKSEHSNWLKLLESTDSDKKLEFERLQNGDLPNNSQEVFLNIKKSFFDQAPKWATRKSSGEVLKTIANEINELIGGSADLSGSNLTKTDATKPINGDDFSGRYIYYGVREHAMAAVMNGIALHKGFIPYGGTFLVFTDYCRPAIRLSALMEQRVIYVMTHDSIGLGEDGPTHQPVEHLASLRAIPNNYVFRPADAIETAECWQLALNKKDAPAILALTRQGIPMVREEFSEENLSSFGAYIISNNNAEHKVTIFATGSEVEIALTAKSSLEAENIGTRVVSMPCMELFEEQDADYQNKIIGPDEGIIKVAVEAACKQGWEKYIGRNGIFIGMQSFGASAPIKDLYNKFGITAENIVNKVKERI